MVRHEAHDAFIVQGEAVAEHREHVAHERQRHRRVPADRVRVAERRRGAEDPPVHLDAQVAAEHVLDEPAEEHVAGGVQGRYPGLEHRAQTAAAAGVVLLVQREQSADDVVHRVGGRREAGGGEAVDDVGRVAPGVPPGPRGVLRDDGHDQAGDVHDVEVVVRRRRAGPVGPVGPVGGAEVVQERVRAQCGQVLGVVGRRVEERVRRGADRSLRDRRRPRRHAQVRHCRGRRRRDLTQRQIGGHVLQIGQRVADEAVNVREEPAQREPARRGPARCVERRVVRDVRQRVLHVETDERGRHRRGQRAEPEAGAASRVLLAAPVQRLQDRGRPPAAGALHREGEREPVAEREAVRVQHLVQRVAVVHRPRDRADAAVDGVNDVGRVAVVHKQRSSDREVAADVSGEPLVY